MKQPLCFHSVQPPVRLRSQRMVIRGARGVDVGDAVRVRLVSLDIGRGFINLERVT